MTAREEVGARRAEHHDGRAAHLLDERAERADPVGPRAVDVFEDQQQRGALRVDFEEAAEHRERDELKGLRVLVDGLGERRGAHAEAQVRAEEVQDLVDATVAEEVHHLRADLVGLREGVGALSELKAVAEDPRDGGVEPRLGPRDAAVGAQVGVVLREVGDDLGDEATLTHARVADDGHHLGARLADRARHRGGDRVAVLHAPDERRTPDREVLCVTARRRAVDAHRQQLSFKAAECSRSYPAAVALTDATRGARGGCERRAPVDTTTHPRLSTARDSHPTRERLALGGRI